MPVKTGLLLSLFVLTLQAIQIKDLSSDVLSGMRNIKYRHFLELTRPASQMPAEPVSLAWNRAKRSALLNTGVKVCPQESMAEVSSSHKAYYKLRVCQEAIWEAFQIFLDRVPDTMEYQQWVYACQKDSLCVDDLAQNFSHTHEHHEVVAKSMGAQDEAKSTLATAVSVKKCSKTPAELSVMESEESGVPAATPAQSVEHVIEFSVGVENPGHSNADTIWHHDVIHSLHKQMLQIFSKFPGFKEIQLLGHQYRSRSGVGGSSGIESGHSGTETALRDIVVKSLSEDSSLPLDSHSLSLEPDLPKDSRRYRPGDIGTEATGVISDGRIENTSISERDTSPNQTHGRMDEETTENTRQGKSKHLALTNTLAARMEQPPLEPKGGLKVYGNLITKLTQITEESKRNSTLDYSSKVLEMTAGSQNLNSFEAVRASISDQSSVEFVTVSEASHREGTSSIPPYFTSSKIPKDNDIAVVAVESMNNPSEVLSSEPLEPSSPTQSPGFPSIRGPPEPVEFQSAFHSIEPILTQESRPATADPLPPVLSALPMTPKMVLDEQGWLLQPYSPHPPDSVLHDMTMQATAQEAKEKKTKAGNHLDYGKRGPSKIDKHPQSSVLPLVTTTPSAMANNQAKDLVVFFRLWVTNTVISENLFNESYLEYKFQENTFLELLLPYLQSNLTGFKELKILNSSVVNSKIKLAKPVPYNATKATHCVVEDVCNATTKTPAIEINTQSVDFATDHGSPCKYMVCGEFSHCTVDTGSAKAECVCDPGYDTADDLPCQSICNLQPNYCLNGGQCEIIPGHGVTCRCPVGKLWHYHEEHCNELVSLTIDPLIFTACLVGCVTMLCALIGILVVINNKWMRTRKTVTLVHSHSSLPDEGGMKVNPVFENYEGILTHVSSISYPKRSDSRSSQLIPGHLNSDQFQLVENLCLGTEVKCTAQSLFLTRTHNIRYFISHELHKSFI